MGYRGWHGVTDKKNVLLAVSYEPIEGTLACRFKTAVLIYFNVPEAVYQLLLKTPFALKEYNRRVRNVYPGVDANGTPLPFKGKPPEKASQPVQEIPEGTPQPQMSLFVELAGKAGKRSRRS